MNIRPLELKLSPLGMTDIDIVKRIKMYIYTINEELYCSIIFQGIAEFLF